MAKKPEQAAAVTGNVMLYKNPIPLAKEKHAKMGVAPVSNPFEFLAKSHFLPLTAPEFGPASTSFPIIFAGESRNPLAVMGIRGDENILVDENGNYNQDYYMPAFARRYPFVLAGDDKNERYIVCIDEDADCVVSKNPTQKFFEGDELSTFTQEAFNFLQAFEADRRATEVMVARFNELDLFEQKDMHFQGTNPDGTPAERQKIADYFAISEDKLKKLSKDVIFELTEKGYLAVAYAHIVSLNNWQRLVNLTLARATAEAQSA